MPTLTVYPSGYDAVNSDFRAFASGHGPEQCYYSADQNTTYCQINVNNGEYAETKFYFTFNTSGLPAGATINSVSCAVNMYVNVLTNVDTKTVQMSSGTTPKGTPSELTTTLTKHVLDVGTWTAAELEHACIYIHIVRNNLQTSNAKPTRVFGATLTIDYTWNPLDGLITDRTQADVDRLIELYKKDSLTADELTEYQNSKGAYNYTDLNRVETAVAYLAAAFVQAPIDLRAYASDRNVAWDDVFDVPYDSDDYDDLTTKTNWADTDIPSATQMTRYLANVTLIQAALPSTVTLPTTMNNLTFAGANNIERALIIAYSEFTDMVAVREGYIRSAMEIDYSGEIYSGEGEA